MPKPHEPTYSFPKKVWLVGGIFALIVVILLLLKATFNVFLLILAGTLIAVFFRTISSFIVRKTHWNSALALTISIIGTFLIISAIFWLIGAKVQSQIVQLIEVLPGTIQNAKEHLNNSGLGQEVIDWFSSTKPTERLKSVASGFFKTTFGILGDLYVILFIGIFFTVAPNLYINGIVQLVPQQGRKEARDIMEKLGNGLKKWLTGKLFAMLVVFILTAIGLAIIGVPMWLALALIAGLLNFIPNFGPLIAMVPAILVAFTIGPNTAIIVMALYLFVQLLESNFITPKVQQKLVKIAPAVIIISQVLVGTLTGFWGIILATPIVVVVMILAQELYIKKEDHKSLKN